MVAPSLLNLPYQVLFLALSLSSMRRGCHLRSIPSLLHNPRWFRCTREGSSLFNLRLPYRFKHGDNIGLHNVFTIGSTVIG